MPYDSTLVRQAETEIVTAIVDRAMRFDYVCEVWNGGDTPEIKNCTDRNALLEALGQTDDDDRLVLFDPQGRLAGFIVLVYGNCGYDVVADYSMGLEDNGFLKPINDLAERWEQRITGPGA